MEQEPLDTRPAELKDTKRFWVILAAIVSGIYLLNPGFGIFDIIPDNLPIIGNLDEGMAAYVIISALAYLKGVDFGIFGTPKDSQ